VHYTDKKLCRVRTVTAFLVLDKEKGSWKNILESGAAFCSRLADEFSRNGYLVQSIRIVTNPFGEYLDTGSLESAKADLEYISSLLNGLDLQGMRIRFAIGEAKNSTEMALLPELILAHGDLCNACVNVTIDDHGVLDNEMIRDAVAVVREIGSTTPRGEGNFNFTVNFNCEPLIPYFPASYHDRALGNCFVVGLETPDLLVNVLQDFNGKNPEVSHDELMRGSAAVMRSALQYHVDHVLSIVEAFPDEHGFSFAGIDSSAAPSKDCSSMVDVYKLMGVEYFGAAGTVEASAMLTRVFKGVTGVPLVGFSGLMLAVTEDTGLAEATRRGEFDIRSLLTCSAVCGIGLDTVPIPGSTSAEKITALMRDTGTMAFRLNKPLTVRLFPVPGVMAGESTTFESDDLCNCTVLEVP